MSLNKRKSQGNIILEAKFYETYYFCNCVRNILHDQFSYVRNLNDFYGEERFLGLIEPFAKYSTFHCFIEFIIENIYYESAENVDFELRNKIIKQHKNHPKTLINVNSDKLPIELALKFHSIEHQSFTEYLIEEGKAFLYINEDDVFEYISELRWSGAYEKLIQHTVKEVFHVLFQNRGLMLLFNDMMASALEFQNDIVPPDELKHLFAQCGILKRKSMPKWAKRAVFFRDKGRCVLCDKDLSGTLNLENLENYDHIVPLAKYGLNDISNIQLLCQECNQIEKKDGHAITSNKYQSWYAYDKI